jgi:hypothetical protein
MLYLLQALMNHEVLTKVEMNHPGFQVTALCEFIDDNDLNVWIPDPCMVLRYCPKYLANGM